MGISDVLMIPEFASSNLPRSNLLLTGSHASIIDLESTILSASRINSRNKSTVTTTLAPAIFVHKGSKIPYQVNDSARSSSFASIMSFDSKYDFRSGQWPVENSDKSVKFRRILAALRDFQLKRHRSAGWNFDKFRVNIDFSAINTSHLLIIFVFEGF